MLDARLLPWQGPQVDPRLIASNHLLQLSTLEVEQAIRQELEENPALELTERTICLLCGAPLHAGFCPQCDSTTSSTPDPASEAGAYEASRDAEPESDAYDPFKGVAVPVTLPEYLLAQLRLVVEEQDHEIALYLVGNLDAHGYLTVSIEELAHTLHVPLSRVMTVLSELQRLDPAGIGARDVKECLLLQLDRLQEQGAPPPSATRQIVCEQWEALGHHQFEQIRAALQITREEVEEAFLFIRANLHPYPAHHYYAEAGDGTPASAPAIPSLVIHKSATAACGYEVEVVESRRFVLRLNPLYQQIKQQSDLALSPAELAHVTQFLERGRVFLSQLQRRHTFLARMGTYLVEYQRAFLDQGQPALRPLTQTMVAEALGVHASTISRAVSGKFAQVPSQKLLPLSRFFSAETAGAQELIRQIIASETTPLSDERIARLLKEAHGIILSRQMVAHYRMELRLPAARQRALLRRS